MVSKTYANQFRVTDLENADSRSIGYLIGRQHHILIGQVQKMGFKYKSGFHKCTRLNSGITFESPCIFMSKENWLKYFEKTRKLSFIPQYLL